MPFRIRVSAVVLIALSGSPALAQSFEVGVHVAPSQWSEFEESDLGLGGRLTWNPSTLVGVDADLTWYRTDFPKPVPFSRSRFEGLFGVTVGPRIGRLRPFAKFAGGFLDVGATPGGFACIAIFPPPLACALAGGATLPAVATSVGADLSTSARTFVRADGGYRFLKYPGPAFDSRVQRQDAGWWGGAWRFTLGAGWRF